MCVCVCVYDLLTVLNNISLPILFADNTSVIIRIINITDFQGNIKTVFEHLIELFLSNILSLNFDKINFIQFKTNVTFVILMTNENESSTNTSCTRLLALTLDNALVWKTYTNILMAKLSTACYTIRVFKQS